MSLQCVLPFVFDFLPNRWIEVEVSAARLSGDGGCCRSGSSMKRFNSRPGALVDLRSEASIRCNAAFISHCIRPFKSSAVRGLTGNFLGQLFYTICQRSIHAPFSLVWLKRVNHLCSHFAN